MCHRSGRTHQDAGMRPFLDTIWTAIDEAVTLQDCEVYSYKSDGEADPFGMR